MPFRFGALSVPVMRNNEYGGFETCNVCDTVAALRTVIPPVGPSAIPCTSIENAAIPSD
jgi:hypothetical protein